MDHKIAFELLDAYAFGILEDEERRAVEEHLATGCRECAARLRDVSELSVRLARAVPQKTPPAHLKEKLFARVATSHHPARDARSTQRREPVRATLRLAWGTAAVAVVAAGVLLWQTMTLRYQVADVKRALADITTDNDKLHTEMASYKNELDRYRNAIVVGEPGMRFVNLAGLDMSPRSFGSVVTKPDKSSGVMYVYKFPMPPEDKEYQLWGLQDDGPPVSLGMFTVDPSGAAMLSLTSIDGGRRIVGFAVTIEPRGGMPAPTGDMYVKGMDPMEEADG